MEPYLVGKDGIEPTHPGEIDLQSTAPLQLRRLPFNTLLRMCVINHTHECTLLR